MAVMDSANVTLVTVTADGEPRTVMTGNRLSLPDLTPGEIRERISGNRCRYGAYVNIVAARRGSRAVQRGTTGNEPA